MLFNSIDFAVFLPVVFLLYWFAFGKNLLLQNLFVVVASYVFYGWWDWRFLILIGFTTLCSWLSGILILKIRERRFDSKKGKHLSVAVTAANITVNLLILGFFKYYNFFVDSFVDAFALFGKQLNIHTLKIILPVGISFYTFQALSYTIDIYRHKLKPTKDVAAFFAFVCFFPQLVAGPIERATQLLPQFQKVRTFEYAGAIDGLRQMLWGLFKKVVVADNCAAIVNDIFSNYETLGGSRLLIGAVFFAFQIYGDFSGYSDMAIGCGRLFGIRLMQNFNYPYFSRDIAEFWRRWHISLTTWFRDYIYIPLGGSRGSKWLIVRNTFIIFLLSGFWHGANWTFVVWGAYHALLFLPLILSGRNRKYTNTAAEGKIFPSIKDFFQMVVTFLLVVIGWIFFRAENIYEAFGYLGRMLQFDTLKGVYEIFDYNAIWFCLIMIMLEWLGRQHSFALEKLGLNWKPYIRRLFYVAIVIIIILFMDTHESPFIYFQF